MSLIPSPHLFGHEEGFEFSVLKVLNEGGDSVGGEIGGFRFELGHVLAEVDQADGGTVVLGQTEEFEDAFVLLVGDVDVDKEDAALVVLGRGAKLVLQLLEVRR